MKLFIQVPIGPTTGLAEIDVLPDHTIGEVKQQVCASFEVDQRTVALMYGGMILDDGTTVASTGVPENAQLALMPYNIIGGVPDLPLLYEEKRVISHQFPMVTALNDPPTRYEGMLRCEKGPVKELADKKIWPFTEYVNWHRYRLELPYNFPLKPPIVTWITNISHPNVVPNVRGAVCVSILGEQWKPNLKIVSIINSLFFLLVDPNPNNVFNHPKCLQAAKICRSYGFPKEKMVGKPAEPSDVVRFTVVPVPEPSDVVRFTVPSPKRKKTTKRKKRKKGRKTAKRTKGKKGRKTKKRKKDAG